MTDDKARKRAARSRAKTQHSVRATPVTTDDGAPGLRLVVTEHPTEQTQADATVPAVDTTTSWQRLNDALDPLSYTAVRGLWQRLPGGILYAPARPERLAERDWWTLARVRVVKQTTVTAVDPRVDRTFRLGEELTMNQSGRAGHEVDRSAWWSSTDIDGAHIVRADCVEVVAVVEDHPPTWQAAALSPSEVAALLGPHHAGATEAAATWADAGLHVAHEHGGLTIRTPAPEYRRVGQIPRDPRAGDRHSGPYEAITRDGDYMQRRTRRLDHLPPDPVAAARDLG